MLRTGRSVLESISKFVYNRRQCEESVESFGSIEQANRNENTLENYLRRKKARNTNRASCKYRCNTADKIPSRNEPPHVSFMHNVFLKVNIINFIL